MKKICSECKTENEEQFLFCKNCGNPLEEEHKTEEPIINPVSEKTQPVYSVPHGIPVENPYEIKKQQSFFEEPDNILGIEKKDFTTFIGKNGQEIYSKFAKMEYSGSKISWCWTAAILQFTLGFLGSAIWFFYRKMYKLAILFVAIGLVFTTVTTILTYDEQISTSRDVLENFYQFLDESESDDVNPQSNIIEDIENAPDSNTTIIKPGIAKVLGWIEQFVGTAIVGMFALYFYKKRCIKKIIEFKNSEVDSRYYSYCLGLVGGTSGGMLAIGIIIAFLVTTVVESTVILQLLYLYGG